MKELTSGDITIKVRASNMALFYFEQEFNENLLSVVSKIFGEVDALSGSNEDNTKQMLDSFGNVSIVGLLKVIWAMNKAENLFSKKETKGFVDWLMEYENFNVLDCIMEVFELISDGFFRTSEKSKSKPTKGKQSKK